MTFRILKKWEEKRFFEFKKSDIYNPALDIGSADNDPYPNRHPHEIVERRVIGSEFFIRGECVSDTPLGMGINLVVDNLSYTVVEVDYKGDASTNQIKTTFTASHFEEFVRPVQLLETIRKEKLFGRSG